MTSSQEKRDNGVSVTEQDASAITPAGPLHGGMSGPSSADYAASHEKHTLAGQKEASAPRMPQADA